MRKYIFIGIVTSFVLACSFTGAISAPESPPASPTASPTRTSTPTPTATSTPRNTPTDIGYMLTQTALAPIQLLPGVYTATPISTVTPVDFATPATAGEGFESVEISEHKIFWGICKPHETTMTITVQHPDEVTKVYLFFRLKSAIKEDYTPWVGTITDNNKNGTFTYVLRANNIPQRKSYLKAWVEYQFVAENKLEVIVGRSQIYLKNLTLEPCK